MWFDSESTLADDAALRGMCQQGTSCWPLPAGVYSIRLSIHEDHSPSFCSSCGMALNLEKQLQFYGAYHHHPINIGIHVVCVPFILVTAILFGTNTSPLIPLPELLQIPNLSPNLGTITALLYSTLYILMEPVAGGLLAPLLLSATAYANHLTSNYGRSANYCAFILHVLCWVAQFVGHGAFEGRAPALTDNLVQALFLAPFFVWMEVLFRLGYRPELQARLSTAVQQDIAKHRASKGLREAANGAAEGH